MEGKEAGPLRKKNFFWSSKVKALGVGPLVEYLFAASLIRCIYWVNLLQTWTGYQALFCIRYPDGSGMAEYSSHHISGAGCPASGLRLGQIAGLFLMFTKNTDEIGKLIR